MQRLDRRARGDPQLLAKKGPQILIDRKRLRYVAAGGQRRHQEAITGLTERSRRDECPRVPLPGGQFGPPERGASSGGALERAQTQFLHLAALILNPWRVVPGQEPTACAAQCGVRLTPRRSPLGKRQGTIRLPGGPGRLFKVNRGSGWEHQAECVAALDHPSAKRAPDL